MKVYLAGPITGKTFADAQSWRDYAAAELERHGITALSPLRDKQHLADAGPLPNDFDGGPAAVNQDLCDIYDVDVVLANFTDADSASIGTCAELGYAYALARMCAGPPKIVSVVPEGNIHDHIFIQYMSDYVESDLDAGIALVRRLADCRINK